MKKREDFAISLRKAKKQQLLQLKRKKIEQALGLKIEKNESDLSVFGLNGGAQKQN